MDERILNDPTWQQLDADARITMAQKGGSFAEAIREIGRKRPDRVPNADLLARILELIEKNPTLSVMAALELIKEQEKIALTHTRDEDVEVYSKESRTLHEKALALAKERAISYSDALREVSSSGVRTEEYTSDKEKGEMDEKERKERDELAKSVEIYQAQNPDDKRTFTQLFTYILDLKEKGITFAPGKDK